MNDNNLRMDALEKSKQRVNRESRLEQDMNELKKVYDRVFNRDITESSPFAQSMQHRYSEFD